MSIDKNYGNFEEIGIPEILVKMIEICNLNTYCKVGYHCEFSLNFKVQSRLKQGHAMSPIPILFNLVLKKKKLEIYQ